MSDPTGNAPGDAASTATDAREVPSRKGILGRIRWRESSAVIVVTICTGLLFGISANLARSNPSTLGLDLPALVSQRQEEIGAQEEGIKQMQQQVDDLLARVTAPPSQAGYIPLLIQHVTGPGIYVELDDVPADAVVAEGVNVNSLVVHQEDVDAVMNALWRGGAEAMTVQGVRITPFTPVRCIGNVILVGGTAFGPPYRIEAIGDPSALNDALTADPQVSIYMEYVRAYGMGWSVKLVDELSFPPLEEGFTVKYAEPLEGNL